MTFAKFLAVQVVTLCTLIAQSSHGAERPNIILILADDLGYECLGCYGGLSYETPNLDSLAATGIRFTNCFSTPKCSPSRVTIMTGRYTIRTTLKWGLLPAKERTFGHVLRDAGYATALAGKWQMGRVVDDRRRVAKAGFDHSAVWGWHEGPRYWKPLIYHNDELMTDVEDRYGPDVYCDFLIRFIEKQAQQDNPFLAYYPMTLTHFPKSGEPKGPNGKWDTFEQMVVQMDRQIGKLIAALERLKIRNNTLVLFTGDNGTPRNVTSHLLISEGNPRRIAGGKGLLTNAGTRVPLIASWPGTTVAGQVNDNLIDFTDFLPTLAALAGGVLPANTTIDGQSFAWQLTGGKGQPRDWVFTEWDGKRWIRDQRWKLYAKGKLFAMQADPDEQHAIRSESDTADSGAARRRLAAAMRQLLESVKP